MFEWIRPSFGLIALEEHEDAVNIFHRTEDEVSRARLSVLIKWAVTAEELLIPLEPQADERLQIVTGLLSEVRRGLWGVV